MPSADAKLAAEIVPSTRRPRSGACAMTVLRSASGSRIDCDECAHHAAAPTLPLDALRGATGYVSVDSRDFCPSCCYRHTALRFRSSSEAPSDDGPAAA